jgi:parallel beta-helix repeat protein
VLENLKNGRVETTSIYRSRYGIYLKKTVNTTIIDCITFYNTRGLVLEQTNRCQIMNNSMYGNWQYGVEISTSSHNNSIYGNSIGWNDWHNAFDEGKDNCFDDNSTIGNYWSDYTAQELYMVPGSANSVDSFAQFLLDYIAPFLSNHPDIEIDIDTDGNTLTWSAYDEFPHSYIIWENEERLGPFIWPGGNITVSLDHLELGTHEFTITVFDGAGNQASDDVLIFVRSYFWSDIGPELVLFASLITVVIFVIVLLLIKRLV